VFIDRGTIAEVIDAAPDAEWRLLIALSRFGGLRVPSEALALRWADINWEHNRMTVRSPKTEHHEGKGERIVPLFPEIREHLQAVFDAAPEGAVNVIGRYREGVNLNPQLRRIIKRAGLMPWDRTWHNLRASRQTELAATFPLATACAWIGNKKAIAAGHYLQITDADWARATGAPESGAKSGAHSTQKAAQQVPASVRTDSADDQKPLGNKALREPRQSSATRRESVQWAEPDLNTPGNPSGKRTPAIKAAQNAAHFDAISTPKPASAGGTTSTGTPERAEVGGDLPDDVRLVVEAWPHLPPAIRAGVLAMVKAAASTGYAGGVRRG
jgi:hypothetical protein